MKMLTTVAIVTTLVSGISVAAAQNAPTTKAPVAPNNINKGSEAGTQSGAESRSAATGRPAQVSGRGKFCSETSANGTLNCEYASMDACKKATKTSNFDCVANPGPATTGAK